jgi:hypothetical protein
VTDCYSFNSYDTVVDSEATGEYGYTDSSGVTLLGHFDYKIKWSLNGHQMNAYAGLTLSGSFDPTGVQYLRALEYLRSGTNGSTPTVISATLKQGSVRPFLTGGGTFYTPTFQLFDNSHTFYTDEFSMNWSVPGYPGYWWVNVRSPIYSCASSTSACYFSESEAPANALQAQWVL